MPPGLDRIILVPRLPASAGSWWLDVPREQWGRVVEGQRERLRTVTLAPLADAAPRRQKPRAPRVEEEL